MNPKVWLWWTQLKYSELINVFILYLREFNTQVESMCIFVDPSHFFSFLIGQRFPTSSHKSYRRVLTRSSLSTNRREEAFFEQSSLSEIDLMHLATSWIPITILMIRDTVQMLVVKEFFFPFFLWQTTCLIGLWNQQKKSF